MRTFGKPVCTSDSGNFRNDVDSGRKHLYFTDFPVSYKTHFSERRKMDYDCVGALKRFFGFDDFLDNQREVVEKVVAGHELCVIMPTGAGKSLCYQLPILMRPGYGIVVSPLISLMKD